MLFGFAATAILSTGYYRTGDLRHRSLDVQLLLNEFTRLGIWIAYWY